MKVKVEFVILWPMTFIHSEVLSQEFIINSSDLNLIDKVNIMWL